MADDGGGYEGQDEDGEDLGADEEERTDEGHAGLWVGQGNQQGDEDGHAEVDDKGVGREAGGIATQFARDDGAGGGCGTDDAQYGALDHHAVGQVGTEDEPQAEQGEDDRLKGYQPPMPAAGAQGSEVNLAEGDEQHAEDE